MLFSNLILVLTLAIGATRGFTVPTCAQISSMSTAITNVLQGGLFPAALRLGFHDCVGGCNGCINFNNNDNAGLANVVNNLTSAYKTGGFSTLVSLADFFALAATVSVTASVRASNQQRSGNPTNGPCPNPCFALQWGRTTASNCSKDLSTFPSPTMTGTAMFSYFKTTFGFTPQQVVALMGAHSIGGAFKFNSGYAGKWTGNQNKGFSEIYYRNMIDSSITWKNVNVAAPTSTSPKWQFNAALKNGTDAGFMLNTDFELFYNLTLDSSAKTTCTLNPTCGLTSCGTTNCQKASTFSQAYSYSQNCTAFMKDFIPVLQTMLSAGYTTSQLTTTKCC